MVVSLSLFLSLSLSLFLFLSLLPFLRPSLSLVYVRISYYVRITTNKLLHNLLHPSVCTALALELHSIQLSSWPKMALVLFRNMLTKIFSLEETGEFSDSWLTRAQGVLLCCSTLPTCTGWRRMIKYSFPSPHCSYVQPSRIRNHSFAFFILCTYGLGWTALLRYTTVHF